MGPDVCPTHSSRLNKKIGGKTPGFPERPWDNPLPILSKMKQQFNILVFLSHGTNLVI
jgi:hypothetical protein